MGEGANMLFEFFHEINMSIIQASYSNRPPVQTAERVRQELDPPGFFATDVAFQGFEKGAHLTGPGSF